MPQSRHETIVPVLLPNADKTRSPSGGLASGRATATNVAANTLDLVRLDPESLTQAINAIEDVVSQVKEQAASSTSISLLELQLELGLSATGKVGILGIGADLQCAAKLQLKFKVE